MPFLEQLPWQAAEQYFRQSDAVIFGVGAVHGHDHIPAGIDNLSTDYLVRELERRTGLLVAPTLPFGPMANYMDFPGCISPRVETFRQFVQEVVDDLYKWGARRIFLVNGHGGNTAPLLDISYEVRKRNGLMPILEWWRILAGINPDLNRQVNALPPTAQEGRKARTRGIETAAALVLAPSEMPIESLRVIYARERFQGSLKTNFATGINYRGFVVPTALGSRETTEIGEVGSMATEALGRAILDECLDYMAGFIQEVCSQPLPPYLDR
ncbi:MAG TPA: creatininase family protein [Chloroflexaceae bacterium]|nr:creatininase family protein [Chloroflexaceae bacterium]